mgnify:CR=1 FL=1
MPDRHLAALLSAAKEAAPADRIQWRDRIAKYGAEAIDPMMGWLSSAALGGFAVRVLERIAADASARRAVLTALGGAEPSRLPGHVASDVADALNRIPGGTAHSGGVRSAAEMWPGVRSVTTLERRFHEAMIEVYHRAGEATRQRRPDGTYRRGYWATYFLRAVRHHGGTAYARQLLRKPGTTAGFQRLKEEGRLDITMEALVLQREFAPLFTDNDRRVAVERLRAAGYFPPET